MGWAVVLGGVAVIILTAALAVEISKTFSQGTGNKRPARDG